MTRCVFLATTASLLLVPSLGAAPPTAERSGIGNALARAKKRNHLTVAYFGGSITEGAGASNGEQTSWRARTTANLKTLLPGVTIKEINAAIGGTGSELGAYRLERDVLSHHPDLVFIEFAVNDGGAPEEKVLAAMEGIVRHLRTSDSHCDIVLVYTLHRGMMDDYKQGRTPTAITFHQRIAAYYRLPEINVGKVLADHIAQAGDNDATWKRYAPDGVHPNDAGYAVYTEEVMAFLRAHQGDKPDARPYLPPKPLTTLPLAKAKLVDAQTVLDADATARGWAKENESLGGRYPKRTTALAPGAELTYRFQGTAIGLYWLIAPDSGDLEWQIDGGKWNRVSSWDSYAKQFSRANNIVLDDRLPRGAHILRLRTLAERNPESTGTALRIGAFLVNE